MPLETYGIQTRQIQLNHPSFDAWVKSRMFDVVLFDRFLTEEQFSWRIREQLPDCTLVLDTEDLHSLRHSREKAVMEGRTWEAPAWLEDPMFYRELASILRCDLSLIISRAEMELLLSRLPFLREILHYLPFQFSKDQMETGPAFSARRDFVFVGNGKHRPNCDAIAWLKSELWPLISERLPGTTLHIYGAYLPPDIRKLNAPGEGFHVHGWAQSLGDVYKAHRLQLAPLRFGAGVKGKILNALRFGLPTLSTPVGWEGIYQGPEPAAFTAEDPSGFARQAAALYTDPAIWRQSLYAQLEAATPHFSPFMEPVLEAVENHKERTRSLPESVRVLQKLLRNQAFDRLKYFSKWIQAKQQHPN